MGGERPFTGSETWGSGPGRVKLSVFDLLGREVVVLVDQEQQPGIYEVSFDGTGLSSGVYLYRLQAGEMLQARTLILLK
jgi:hypothetical protein